jgi:acyl dehydratase
MDVEPAHRLEATAGVETELMAQYFEDVEVGRVIDLGAHTFTRDEIVAFAREFDPQPFHLSDEGAEGTLFSGLCASGWHTSAVWLRHVVDYRRRQADMMRFRGTTPARWGPSPGFDNIRWLKPVYVGDTIRYTTSVREKRPSRSRPEVGLVISDNEGINQHAEVVFQVTSKMLVERRVAASPD